jgi:hypothetical protein
MPSLFAKAAPAVKTQADALHDFEKSIHVAVAEARSTHVDARKLARALRDAADVLTMQWAISTPVV